MRIVHVIPTLDPGGGAEHSLAVSAPATCERAELHVVTFRAASGLDDEVRDAGAVVHHAVSPRRLGRVREITRVIDLVEPDIVVTTLPNADVLGGLAARRRNVPTVVNLVADDFAPAYFAAVSPGQRLHRAALWPLVMTAAHQSGRLRALSEHVATVVGRRLRVGSDRIEVIGRGRSPESLGERTAARRSAARSALGVGDAPVVAAAARHHGTKGLDVLVRAVPAILQAFPMAQVLIGGRDGPATPQLRAVIAELGLGEHVRLIGHRDDLAEMMCAADVWCVPSLSEGFCGVVIEAMALEVPVVGSDIGPIAELDGGTGCLTLFPAGDAAGLARSVCGIVAGTHVPDVVAGRRRFLEAYSVEMEVDRVLDLYERVISEGGAARSG